VGSPLIEAVENSKKKNKIARYGVLAAKPFKFGA